MNKTTGLVLGKIAPMHKGHQFLINEALKIVDELFFVVYDCPDKIHIPTNVRANWIRSLYPNVRVIEGWDAPNEHNDKDINVQKMQEDFISKLLRGQRITHFISSESYGEHMSKHLNAENIIVDMDRININISSTMIRNEMKKYADYLPAIVYKDLLTKVAVIGFDAEESGKITKELAERYNTNHNMINTDIPKNFDLVIEKVKMRKNEFNKLLESKNFNNFAFFNNTILDNYVIAEGILRRYDKDLFNNAIKNIKEFDIVLFNSSITGSTANVKNIFLNNQLKSILKTYKIPYVKLEGTITEKINKAAIKINLNLKNKLFHE